MNNFITVPEYPLLSQNATDVRVTIFQRHSYEEWIETIQNAISQAGQTLKAEGPNLFTIYTNSLKSKSIKTADIISTIRENFNEPVDIRIFKNTYSWLILKEPKGLLRKEDINVKFFVTHSKLSKEEWILWIKDGFGPWLCSYTGKGEITLSTSTTSEKIYYMKYLFEKLSIFKEIQSVRVDFIGGLSLIFYVI